MKEEVDRKMKNDELMKFVALSKTTGEPLESGSLALG